MTKIISQFQKKVLLYVCCTLLACAMMFGSFFLSQLEARQPHMEILPKNIYEETMIVVADLDYQPYSFYDDRGNPAGYDVELIYHLANALEKNVEIHLMSWVEAQQAVRNGQADVLLGLDYNAEELNNFELSRTLTKDPFVAFGKTQLQSIDQLYDKRIATLEGSGGFSLFLTPFQLEENTKTYPSYTEAFQSVQDGENDYAIAMYAVGRRAVANIDDCTLVAGGPMLAGNYLCIGTKKGNTQLMEALNKAIIQMKKDGILDQLGEKWLGRYVEVISFGDFIEKNMLEFMLMLFFLILAIAISYTTISRRYAKTVLIQHEMTKKVLAYEQLLSEATKGLYEGIYEINITHNCAEGQSTKDYFESLGLDGDAPFDQALNAIAQKEVKDLFRPEFLQTFSLENVLRIYGSGGDRLSYEYMISDEAGNDCWLRVVTRIFNWAEDNTVRMIIYSQNIDAEKKREQLMEEKVRTDPMTGLYNKVTIEEYIRQALQEKREGQQAFCILDIDNFKNINDSLGHSFGDQVIQAFSDQLKTLSEDAMVGRIGGDEFAIFMPVKSRSQLEEMLNAIISNLSKPLMIKDKSCLVSASIGVALYPQNGSDFDTLYYKADEALYQTKHRGKNGFTIYEQA